MSESIDEKRNTYEDVDVEEKLDLVIDDMLFSENSIHIRLN